MLQVKGKYIVDEQGKEIVLIGYNVGNWMMLENFMLGYPGTEQEFRAAVKKYAGEENCRYFFKKYRECFLGEKDIVFMREMGMNCIRVPFNYRMFESDNEPGIYDGEVLDEMDRLVEICRKHGMYIILDMHAVQGYQSTAWHCDNNGKPAALYTHADARKRYYDLWRFLADHFRGEEIIAGYDLMNEPDAPPEYSDMLNQIYREAVAAVREVDPNHILFIGGNRYNKDFSAFEAPFAENLAYTPHYYLMACTSVPMNYPGELENLTYDRELIETQMNAADAFMRKYNVPCWIGEFGVRLNYPGYTDDRLKCFSDQLDCICRRRHHYSIWSYKDIGYLSTVTVRPDSPWMEFTKEIRRLKEKYFVDQNFRVNEDWGISMLFDLKDPAGFNDRYGTVKEAVVSGIKHTLSTQLADMLGRKFAGLSLGELDRLAESFAFDNCVIDHRRTEIIDRFGHPDIP